MIKNSLLLITMLSVNSILFSSEVEKENKQNLDELMNILLNEKSLKDKISKEDLELPDSVKQKVAVKIISMYKSESFRSKFMKIYTDNFTSEEIGELVKFLKTKFGLEFFKKYTIVSNASQALFLKEMAPLVIPCMMNVSEVDEVQEVLDESSEEYEEETFV